MERAIRFTWFVIAGVGFLAWREGVLFTFDVLALGLSFIGIAVMAGRIDWHRVLLHHRGEAVLWATALVLLAGVAALSTREEMYELTFPLYFAVVAFSGAIGRTFMHWTVTLGAIALLVISPMAWGRQPSLGDLVPVLSLLIVAVSTRSIAREFVRKAFANQLKSNELTLREQDIRKIYEVTQSVTVRASLSAAVPELLDRVGRHVDAEVAAVLLHDAASHTLDLVSPIWTSGNPLEIGEYRVHLRTKGPLEQVFLNRAPTVLDLDASQESGLLSELGVTSAMAAPLIAKDQAIGVIVVADPRGQKTFDQESLDTLVAVARPAAQVIAQLGSLEDVSESGRRMEELATLKSDFVSVVSHELRTPLTSIIGSLDTVSRPELAPQSESANELLRSARRQAGRLRRLIEDLLMVSQVENRSLPHHPERVEIAQLLEETRKEISANDRVTIGSVEPEDLRLRTDPDHLRRVLINLSENALKHGGDSPVELTASGGNGTVEISVVDHGPGIPDEAKAEIFEAFRQLDPSQTRAHGGAGLGLAIVAALAESLGGHIDLTDTPGGGSTFTIHLSDPESRSTRL